MSCTSDMRQPFRARMSWREWYYGDAQPPPGTQIGDSIPVREDAVCEADVEAVVRRMVKWGATDSEETDRQARALLALVLGDQGATGG